MYAGSYFLLLRAIEYLYMFKININKIFTIIIHLINPTINHLDIY